MNAKISLPERILMLIFAISADATDALAALGVGLPFIGPALPFMAWPIGFTISTILLFWVYMKGVKIRWMLGGSGIELIPLLNALPGRTAGVIATIAIDMLPPEAEALTSAATGKKTPGKGTETKGREKQPRPQPQPQEEVAA